MAHPVFRLVTPPGITSPMGSKLWAFGQEVPDLKAVDVRVNLSGVDELIETTLIIKLIGTGVLVETSEDLLKLPRSRHEWERGPE
jgi:hypothetical protein